MTQAYRVRGGHEAHLLHFATELRRHGFRTRIMVLDALPREPHLFMRQLTEQGIALDGVRDERGWLVRVLSVLAFLPWSIAVRRRGKQPQYHLLLSYIADRLSAIVLKRAVRREQPDIIHVLGRLADYAYPVLPTGRSVFHHGTEGLMDKSWDEEELGLFKTFIENAARNFAPGRGVADNVTREFGIKRGIDTIYTICPDRRSGFRVRGSGFQVQGAESHESEGEVSQPIGRRAPNVAGRQGVGSRVSGNQGIRFGILCRMTEEKGIRHLLPALKAYREKHGSVDFVFAGTGSMQQEIRNYLDTYDMLEVKMISAFSTPGEILENMDVFVHPSLSDAMPMAIAEALMCGLPCVVTDVGGIPDLVRDGQEGFIIKSGSDAEIVNAMERFAAMDPQEFSEFGRRARERYEEVCRPERVGSVIAEHYSEMIKESMS